MQELPGFSSGDAEPVRDSAAAEYEWDSGPACLLKAIVYRQFFTGNILPAKQNKILSTDQSESLISCREGFRSFFMPFFKYDESRGTVPPDSSV